MQQLTIYSEHHEAPRLQYSLEVLFGGVLACAFKLTGDSGVYLAAEGPRINYSRRRLCQEELFIPAGPLLRDSSIDSGRLPKAVSVVSGLPAFFFMEVPDADLPFDLFALVFFLVSRYEEYLPFSADVHGRFPAAAGSAYRYGFLERPLVDEWGRQLSKLIKSRFPDWECPPKAYDFQPTYDIDIAWAYRHRNLLRTLLALVRNFPKDTGQRLSVLLGKQKDPYLDAIHWLEDLHAQQPADPVFFFLLAAYGRFDRGIHYRRRALQLLIRDLAGRYRTGIHPSYRCSKDYRLLSVEIRRLATLLQEPVIRSRQHYLRLRFPDTFRALLQHGIKTDFTMGFADAIGFRASIARPFPWYDLRKEKTTALRIWPFQLMDVTLKNYLQLSPAEAIAAALPLIMRTQRAGGIFTTLWHNSSLAEEREWAGWREVYRQIYSAAYDAKTMDLP